MSAEALATVILAAVAILGGIGAIIAWFYKRGSSEAKLTVAVDANTKSTDNLARHMERVADKINDHDVRLADHDARLRAGGL